jgi:N6-adenosine-specific RNA methylase IME4
VTEQEGNELVSKNAQLVIDAEFAKLLFPLAPDEYAQLEQNLLRDGCLHPLTAWRENGKKLLLLDGYNRLAICTKHGIKFEIDTIEIESRQWAKIWIRRNQLGRRNLPDDARAMAAAWLYKDVSALEKRERARKAGKAGGRGRPRTSLSTAAVEKQGKKDNLAVVAKESKVSQRRVRAALAFEKQAIAVMGEDAAQKVCDEIGQGKLTIARARQEIKQQNKLALAEKIRQEQSPLPTGPFRVIAIDPPWQYSRADDLTHRARNPYPDMTLDAIKALPVADLAHTDCILWLWTTNAFIWEARECLDAWGFEKKTILTWVKDKMGIGDWLRGRSEHCLMAVKGKPLVDLTNQTTVITGPLREHSRKPDAFYALVESLCPGNKLEMFQLEPRENWQGWGARHESRSATVN